jgi:hypothetical protein
MPNTRRPVELFISYAHLDRKHLDKLRANLAGLERGGHVTCWWDGVLQPGKPWEPLILDALRRADVVVLLLTANFLNSDYSIETELQAARAREQQGQLDLIPVLVESFDLGAHWLSQLQAITVNGKSVVESRLGASAWGSVARQIRLKVECIEGKRPVMQALTEVEEVVHSGDFRPAPAPPGHRPLSAQFHTVSAFWKSRSTVLQDLDLVTVQGTLSQFAPMLMGPPRAKRVLHREFRRAIETHRSFGERKRLTINACMSISSGQMVHHERRTGNEKRLLGLYESIVRNAIPIFVQPAFYESKILPALRDTRGSGCFEALVTGRPFQLDNNYIRRFLARQGIDQILPAFVIDDLCRNAYALDVGGPGSDVEALANQPVRYLDGDIWVAAAVDGAERFFTAFVDITSETEREEEMNRLRQESASGEFIAAYDEVQSIAQLLEKRSA